MPPTWPGCCPDDQIAGVLSGEVDLPLGEMVSDDGLRFVLFPGDFETEDLREWVDFAAEKYRPIRACR